jgi:hypothetical protein
VVGENQHLGTGGQHPERPEGGSCAPIVKLTSSCGTKRELVQRIYASWLAIKLARALASSWGSVCGFHTIPNPGPS